MEDVIIESEEQPRNYKKLFLKLGTCSQTLFHILNREFDHPLGLEENAADPLAGGILRQGKQCGMLWGSALAVGAEAYRTSKSQSQAMVTSILATQAIMKSFMSRTQSIDCRDITECDWNNKLSISKYFLTGRFMHCFNLVQDWAPEAIRVAREGLAAQPPEFSEPCRNCASEVAARLGAGDQEIVMVSGLAGGMGLSGGGCGALGAAIWLSTFEWCGRNDPKKAYKNADAKEILEAFLAETEDELLCYKLTGRKFASIEEHSEFIQGGGCAKLIDLLVKASQ
jgi:hypothetical protein